VVSGPVSADAQAAKGVHNKPTNTVSHRTMKDRQMANQFLIPDGRTFGL
jgi:hypothetical protein